MYSTKQQPQLVCLDQFQSIRRLDIPYFRQPELLMRKQRLRTNLKISLPLKKYLKVNRDPTDTLQFNAGSCLITPHFYSSHALLYLLTGESLSCLTQPNECTLTPEVKSWIKKCKGLSGALKSLAVFLLTLVRDQPTTEISLDSVRVHDGSLFYLYPQSSLSPRKAASINPLVSCRFPFSRRDLLWIRKGYRNQSEPASSPLSILVLILQVGTGKCWYGLPRLEYNDSSLKDIIQQFIGLHGEWGSIMRYLLKEATDQTVTPQQLMSEMPPSIIRMSRPNNAVILSPEFRDALTSRLRMVVPRSGQTLLRALMLSEYIPISSYETIICHTMSDVWLDQSWQHLEYECSSSYLGLVSQDGMRHGEGVYLHYHGDAYIGQWAQDQMDGFGIWINNKGQVFEGFFCKGRRNGIGAQYSRSTNWQLEAPIFIGEWDEDSMSAFQMHLKADGSLNVSS